MTQTPWTPGPWALTGYHRTIIAAGAEFIGSTTYGVDNREANARLIAAAPELAEALEELLEYEPARAEIRPDAKGDRQHTESVAVFAAARAALAKAKGETP